MKLENNWKYKSLVNLQKLGNYVPSKNPQTSLVAKCEALFLKPLDEYSIENLRIMIGQQLGLEYLVPLAIEKLQENILAEGDFYPGDLLLSVLRVNADFWKQNQDLNEQLNSLVRGHRETILEEGISLKLFESNI